MPLLLSVSGKGKLEYTVSIPFLIYVDDDYNNNNDIIIIIII